MRNLYFYIAAFPDCEIEKEVTECQRIRNGAFPALVEQHENIPLILEIHPNEFSNDSQ
jgi:hypothetical protein